MARSFYPIAAILLPLAIGTCLTPSAPAATPLTVASNFGNPDAGLFTGFNSDHRAANLFTTGAMPAVLNSATLRLASQVGTAQFRAFIYADSSGHPAELINEFVNKPSASAARDLTFFTNTLLEPATRYWLGVTTVSGDGAWPQVTGAGTGSWTIGGLTFSSDRGATWIREIPSRSNVFSLDATLIPEPATATIALLGLVVLAGLCKRLRREYRTTCISEPQARTIR